MAPMGEDQRDGIRTRRSDMDEMERDILDIDFEMGISIDRINSGLVNQKAKGLNRNQAYILVDALEGFIPAPFLLPSGL